MLTQRGIEANPEKCKAIIEMRSPTTIKEVQRLIGRLTVISRFLPKLAEQTQPIVQLLKKSTRFTWIDDCEQIFQKLKNHPNLTSYPPQAGHSPTPPSVHHSHRLHRQRRACPRNRGHAASCLLR